VSSTDLKGLEVYGLKNLGEIKKNLSAPQLYEEIIKNGEGKIADGGAMVCLTGAVTGRSPNDKFIVEEDSTKGDVNWSKGNVAISQERFDAIYNRLLSSRKMFMSRSATQVLTKHPGSEFALSTHMHGKTSL